VILLNLLQVLLYNFLVSYLRHLGIINESNIRNFWFLKIVSAIDGSYAFVQTVHSLDLLLRVKQFEPQLFILLYLS
jgi:hypothetical protein